MDADDTWDFFYADVGWIHENVPYASVSTAFLAPAPNRDKNTVNKR